MAPRKSIRPPSGLSDHLSRRETAALLGFASEFKVRQLEKEGRLRAVRGVVGSAWYARAEVLALKETLDRPAVRPDGPGPARPAGRWSDAALIRYLRERARTVVDLVADAGIPISRAERVYRFWLRHDDHAVAEALRGAQGKRSERRSPDRLERDRLLAELRDPDPKARAAAFQKLKARPR